MGWKKALVAVAATAAAVVAAANASDSGLVAVYDTVPDPLPGNVATVPYEPTGTSAFGNRIAFAADAPRSLARVTVVLSSWGCQSGFFYSGDCATAPGAKFTAPVTVHLYAVDADARPGELLATVAHTFAIPYRPSADPACSGGGWYDARAARCFSGRAVAITFDLRGEHVVLPDELIYDVAISTTNYGPEPAGTRTHCYSSAGGCGYDWLGIGLVDPGATLTAGLEPAPADAYQETLLNSCSNGVVTPLGLDAGCWTGVKPAVTFEAARDSGHDRGDDHGHDHGAGRGDDHGHDHGHDHDHDHDGAIHEQGRPDRR
jgi:hypothetical protein